jgi:hypothetical protein
MAQKNGQGFCLFFPGQLNYDLQKLAAKAVDQILFVFRLNPAHTTERHNHQLVAKICL